MFSTTPLSTNYQADFCSLQQRYSNEQITHLSYVLSRGSQPIKIGIDLSIGKSIKIGKPDLIDIDCIYQSFNHFHVFWSVVTRGCVFLALLYYLTHAKNNNGGLLS